ncbi:MAG TPA: PPC domain-containing protein [Longimicrobiales bacterium]
MRPAKYTSLEGYLAFISLTLLLSCDDPAGPTSRTMVELGEREEGSLPGEVDAADTVSFIVPAGHLAAVLLEPDDPLQASISNPNGVTMYAGEAGPGGRWSFRAVTPMAGEWSVVITPVHPDGSRVRYAITALAVDPRPETTDALLPAATVTSEGLATGFDIDRFALSSADGRYLNVFLRSDDRLLASLEGPNAPALQLYPADSLRGAYSGRLELAENAAFELVLMGWGATTAPVPYRLEIYRTNPAPEEANAQLEREVVVEERIGEPGDFDRFTFEAGDGETIDVLLDAPIALIARVYDPSGAEVAAADVGHAPSLPASSGFLSPTAAGTYEVRVFGAWMDTDVPYSLLVHEIDRRPEHGPADLIAGDSATFEAIDPPSDADSFRISLPDTLWLAVAAVRSAELPGSLVLRVDPLFEGGTSFGGVARPEYPYSLLGRFPGGAYRAYFTGSSMEQSFSGPYRLYTSWSSNSPESVSPRLVMGGEVIETAQPIVDIDQFTFGTAARDHFRVAVTAQGEYGMDLLEVYVGPDGRPAQAAMGVASDGSMTTHRVTSEAGDDYAIDVHLERLLPSWTANASYRVELIPEPVAVEHAAQLFTTGDSVMDAIDVIGDVDRYAVSGIAGQDVVVALRSQTGSAGPIAADVFHAARPDSVLGTATSAQSTDLLYTRLDESGTLVVEVLEHQTGLSLRATGSYSLGAWSFSGAPESSPAVLDRAQPVVEALDPVGDVDEFTIAVAAGDTIEVWLGRPSGGISEVRSYVVDIEQNGSVVTTSIVGFEPAGNALLATVSAVAPGTLLVRVRPWIGVEEPHSEPYMLEAR